MRTQMEKQMTIQIDPDQPNPIGRRGAVRRRIKSPAFLSCSMNGGRRSGPVTPLLRWKHVDDGDVKKEEKPPAVEKYSRRKQNGVVGCEREAESGSAVRLPAEMAAAVSARKLAAGIWQLQRPDVRTQMEKQMTIQIDPDQPNPIGRRGAVRRRIKSPAFLSCSMNGGRRSGPVTPLLRWKHVDDGDVKKEEKPPAVEKYSRRKQNGVVGCEREAESGSAVRLPAEMAAAVSARKLAAGIWQLQRPDVSRDSAGMHCRVGFQTLVHGHLQAAHLCNLKTKGHHHGDSKDALSSRVSASSSRNAAVFHQHGGDPSVPFANASSMERATKWDPGFSKTSENVYRFYGQLSFLEDQQTNVVSVVSALQLDIVWSNVRITELENEKRSSKKKLDHFLRKLSEDKALWRNREHEKVRVIINDMKDELNRERKNRQRMEILNFKLVGELKKVKLSGKRSLQEYEKERKARELMEEVCDELAKEIREEKAEAEEIKRDSMKVREEVDEERRMLQMAEVWREERVQMKLVDAKLALEEKYKQIHNLGAELEVFLKMHTGTKVSAAEILEADMLREAVDMVKIYDIKEFLYQPPHLSKDIFSVFEKMQHTEGTYKREIEQSYGYSPAIRASKILSVSPETNNHSACYSRNPPMEDDSGWETISPGEEERGFSNSLENGSDLSVNCAFLESNPGSLSIADWDDMMENSAGTKMVDHEIIEVCSAITRHSTTTTKKKSSSISRLWKSSTIRPRSNNNIGEKHNVTVVDGHRLSTGSSMVSHDGGHILVCLRSPTPSAGLWSSPDLENRKMAQGGIKGCMDWPHGGGSSGVQKQSFKSKFLEASMESQKVQLRHVLEQKS